jgi:hypothetical protein
MRKMLNLTALALGASIATVSAANATIMLPFAFSSNTSGNLDATGILDVVATGFPGRYELTGISGSVFGSDLGGPEAITGPVGNPGFPNESVSPDGAFLYDDQVLPPPPGAIVVTNGGILFTTAGNSGYWNLFSNGSPNNYQLYASDGLNEYGSLTIAAVPESSTLAMMALGFASLGFAGYRTSRKAVSITA